MALSGRAAAAEAGGGARAAHERHLLAEPGGAQRRGHDVLHGVLLSPQPAVVYQPRGRARAHGAVHALRLLHGRLRFRAQHRQSRQSQIRAHTRAARIARVHRGQLLPTFLHHHPCLRRARLLVGQSVDSARNLHHITGSHLRGTDQQESRCHSGHFQRILLLLASACYDRGQSRVFVCSQHGAGTRK